VQLCSTEIKSKGVQHKAWLSPVDDVPPYLKEVHTAERTVVWEAELQRVKNLDRMEFHNTRCFTDAHVRI
jgi:hypothetical protein